MTANQPACATGGPDGLSPQAELRAQRLETVARYQKSNLLPVPLAVMGLGAILWTEANFHALVLWGMVTIALWALEMAALEAFLGDRRRHLRTKFWTVIVCAGIASAAASLGSASLVFWIDGDRLNNVLMYALISAAMAGAGAQAAPSAPVVTCNIIPYAVIYVATALIYEAWPLSLGIVFLQMCFIVLVSLYARAVWQMAGEMLRLRQERRDLVERLQCALVDATAARKRAEAASGAKSEFLASMSHELRTPLNAVMGFSEIIRNRVFGDAAIERYSEYAGHIHFSGRHLLGLINDVLDLSKIEAGRRELDEAPLDLVALARDVLLFVEPQARRKKISLVLEAPAPLALTADERALRQILTNLLSNAVKFTNEGGRVVLHACLGPDGRALLEVSDNGVGIHAEDMGRVMESFGQARHDATTAGEHGTGLGLPIVKGLAELHGGVFELESAPGVGTRASVLLPAARVLSAGVPPVTAQVACA